MSARCRRNCTATEGNNGGQRYRGRVPLRRNRLGREGTIKYPFADNQIGKDQPCVPSLHCRPAPESTPRSPPCYLQSEVRKFDLESDMACRTVVGNTLSQHHCKMEHYHIIVLRCIASWTHGGPASYHSRFISCHEVVDGDGRAT